MLRPLRCTCSRGGPRKSQEPGHEFGLARDAVQGRGRRTICFNFRVRHRGVGGCSATRARLGRRRAHSNALRGLGGSGLSCYAAMRPPCSSERRSGRVSGPSRIPSQTPSGSENARWSVNETRLVVPTSKGQRTTIAGALRTRRAKLG